MLQKLPIIGVMGSGTEATPEAEVVGRLLAGLGVHLLTGGGDGQMKAVARAFTSCEDRRGLSLGILPCHPDDPQRPKSPAYPNEYVELPIRTHLSESSTEPQSRNHINVLTCDALVFLWGSAGTVSEAKLAREYDVPRCLYVSEETLVARPSSPLLGEFEEHEIISDPGMLEAQLREFTRLMVI